MLANPPCTHAMMFDKMLLKYLAIKEHSTKYAYRHTGKWFFEPSNSFIQTSIMKNSFIDSGKKISLNNFFCDASWNETFPWFKESLPCVYIYMIIII